eukprot:g33452.t1
MPHVFNYEENKFEQVHYNKVPQRPTTQVNKRQRTQEAMKFLLKQEDIENKKHEAHLRRKEERRMTKPWNMQMGAFLRPFRTRSGGDQKVGDLGFGK